MSAPAINLYAQSEAWRDAVGMTEAECAALVVVLSGYAYLLRPILSAEVMRNLEAWGQEGSVYDSLRVVIGRGWLRMVEQTRGKRSYEPTERGWRVLGLEPVVIDADGVLATFERRAAHG